MIAVSLSWSAVSIVLALKLCRRPSEWPTSCITMCLIAWPTNSSGSSSLGCGLLLARLLRLCPSAYPWRLSVGGAGRRRRRCGVCRPGHVGHGDRRQGEIALDAGLELAEAPASRAPGSWRVAMRGSSGRRGRPRGPSGSGFCSRASTPSKCLPVGSGRSPSSMPGSGLITSPMASGAAWLLAARGRGAADQQGVRLFPVADEAGVEDDVAVDHLAGQGVGPHAGHGAADVSR